MPQTLFSHRVETENENDIFGMTPKIVEVHNPIETTISVNQSLSGSDDVSFWASANLMVTPVEKLVMGLNMFLYIQSIWSDSVDEKASAWMNYLMLTILYFSTLVIFLVFGRKIKAVIDEELSLDLNSCDADEHVCSEYCGQNDTNIPVQKTSIAPKKGSIKKGDAKKTSAQMLMEDKRQLKEFQFIETVKRNRKQRSY